MNFYPVILLIAGLVCASLGARATFDRAFAARYAATSPKAWIWRKMFGIERATVLMHRVFGPLGIVAGSATILFAVLSWTSAS